MAERGAATGASAASRRDEAETRTAKAREARDEALRRRDEAAAATPKAVADEEAAANERLAAVRAAHAERSRTLVDDLRGLAETYEWRLGQVAPRRAEAEERMASLFQELVRQAPAAVPESAAERARVVASLREVLDEYDAAEAEIAACADEPARAEAEYRAALAKRVGDPLAEKIIRAEKAGTRDGAGAEEEKAARLRLKFDLEHAEKGVETSRRSAIVYVESRGKTALEAAEKDLAAAEAALAAALGESESAHGVVAAFEGARDLGERADRFERALDAQRTRVGPQVDDLFRCARLRELSLADKALGRKIDGARLDKRLDGLESKVLTARQLVADGAKDLAARITGDAIEKERRGDPRRFDDLAVRAARLLARTEAGKAFLTERVEPALLGAAGASPIYRDLFSEPARAAREGAPVVEAFAPFLATAGEAASLRALAALGGLGAPAEVSRWARGLRAREPLARAAAAVLFGASISQALTQSDVRAALGSGSRSQLASALRAPEREGRLETCAALVGRKEAEAIDLALEGIGLGASEAASPEGGALRAIGLPIALAELFAGAPGLGRSAAEAVGVVLSVLSPAATLEKLYFAPAHAEAVAGEVVVLRG